MTGFDVVGFGALNVDKLFKVNRIAGAEEESFVESSMKNRAEAQQPTPWSVWRDLGCKVGFIGKVGGDREGDMLVADFSKEGVDIAGVIRAKHGKSGAVMGFVDKKGQRALYINSGVNDTIALEEVNTRVRFSERNFCI